MCLFHDDRLYHLTKTLIGFRCKWRLKVLNLKSYIQQ